MDERLTQLLRLVIEDVIDTGDPVSSQRIVDTYKLGVSSATVRNWFAELESQGYLIQPHTSAGRLPTEKGYKLYVDELMERKPLGKRELQQIEQSAKKSENGVKTTAKLMAGLFNGACLLGLNASDTYYTGLSQLFAQPEFKDWGRVVDLGEVLDQLDDVLGTIRRKVFHEPTPYIGSSCPFGSATGCVIVTLPDTSIASLLGPMRMNYKLGIALLDAFKHQYV